MGVSSWGKGLFTHDIANVFQQEQFLENILTITIIYLRWLVLRDRAEGGGVIKGQLGTWVQTFVA